LTKRIERIKLLLKRREFVNSAWNTADVIVLPLLLLLATPYFILKLGAEQFGIWMLVNSIVVSIGIFNIGLGDAVIKFLSQYRVTDDNVNIRRIVRTAFTLSSLLTLFIISAGAVASFVLSRFDIAPERYSSVLSYTVFFGSIIFGMKQMEQLSLSIFKGYERYDTSSKISMVSKFLSLFAQVAVVYFGYQLKEIFLVSAIVISFVVLAEYILVVYLRRLSFAPLSDKASVKEVFSFSLWAWIQSVLSVIAGHADRFIVVSFAGAKFLGYYALASTVGGQLHQVLTAAVSWTFPKVSGKTERQEELKGLYYKLQMIIVTAGIMIIGFLLLFENVIFKTWLGAETYNASIILIKLFLYMTFLNLATIIPYFFLLGSGLIRFSAVIMLISVCFTLLFMVSGYYFWGVTGLAYGKVLSAVFSVLITLVFIHKMLIDKDIKWGGIMLYFPLSLVFTAFFLENITSVFLIIAAYALLVILYKKKILTGYEHTF